MPRVTWYHATIPGRMESVFVFYPGVEPGGESAFNFYPGVQLAGQPAANSYGKLAQAVLTVM